jgi:hypothetical protein
LTNTCEEQAEFASPAMPVVTVSPRSKKKNMMNRVKGKLRMIGALAAAKKRGRQVRAKSAGEVLGSLDKMWSMQEGHEYQEGRDESGSEIDSCDDSNSTSSVSVESEFDPSMYHLHGLRGEDDEASVTSRASAALEGLSPKSPTSSRFYSQKSSPKSSPKSKSQRSSPKSRSPQKQEEVHRRDFFPSISSNEEAPIDPPSATPQEEDSEGGRGGFPKRSSSRESTSVSAKGWDRLRGKLGTIVSQTKTQRTAVEAFGSPKPGEKANIEREAEKEASKQDALRRIQQKIGSKKLKRTLSKLSQTSTAS